MRIEMYQDSRGGWRWRGVDGNNRIICDGAESYVGAGSDGVERAIDNVVNEFRSHLLVQRRTDDPQHEVVTVVEYLAQGDHEHS